MGYTLCSRACHDSYTGSNVVHDVMLSPKAEASGDSWSEIEGQARAEVKPLQTHMLPDFLGASIMKSQRQLLLVSRERMD